MAQKYRLIYCAVIHDDKHAGMIKIGDTEFIPTKPVHTYEANEDALQKAAEARIKAWSGTAAAGAKLIYCEALIRYNSVVQNYETYRDSSVHTVLQHSGFPKVDFDSENDSGREWFTVDLETVKAAIKATKEHRDYLDTSELPKKDIYSLREEQSRAVRETIARFEKKNDMLWHAKMRFGKTITALNLVKQKAFKRTIIITHRPVVEDSWGSDFYHVFSNEDKYAFLTKISDAEILLNDDETDETIDAQNDARLTQLVSEDRSFVYFASIQDLRGSKLVGGQFEKNRVVFDIDWDLVIIDEAHEGTKTALGQKVIELLIKKNTKRLDLSGTAYNLFDQYTEKGSVYTWDYIMEQEAKQNWPQKHPDEKNPYEDMPVMNIKTFDLQKAIREQGLDLQGKSFSFREFFRTWTGELGRDGQPVPEGAEIGDFVHSAAVRRFLDLLSQGDENSRFPYVTKDQCNQNRHSLWMVPGVKEAAALSKMLKKHPLFGQESAFGIANVAGEGDHDEETHYQNALSLVRKTIAEHPNSITLSCGRLTTGVTVKEWTSVFMLSGSESTDAKSYMQTIFRVQSAGKIDGVQKKEAFVYDFAPDRALLVVAASVLGSRKGKGGMAIEDEDREREFEKFLQFCPIIAIDGAQFEKFDVQALMSQINRVQIDRALKTGFTDNAIYDMSQFKKLDKKDIEKMNAIFQKLKETKDKKPLTEAGMAKNGLEKDKSRSGKGGSSSGGKKEKDEQKELEKNILEKLRTISIRIPLLFYGGNFEIEEGRLGEIVTGIDPVSWEVFMPANLTKKDFLTLVRYYNQSTVIGAGKIIRSKALEADSMTPTERVVAITNIFGHFHNPSKETVLTPWRVVNMHMADTLGGYRFFNSKYEDDNDEYYKRLLDPEFVDHGKVTADTLGNPDAVILEINSKSGLYPLYVAYSLYRAKLGDRDENEMLREDLLAIWDEAVQQVYVLCQSSMAADITKRTLVGYRSVNTNIRYDIHLLENLIKSVNETAKAIKRGSYWREDVKEVKFDVVVGNPPYQEETGNTRKPPVYHYFYDTAFAISDLVSLITPARFLFDAGQTPKAWNDKMLSDPHFKVVRYFEDSKEIFPTVEIKGGVAITYRDSQTDFGAINTFTQYPELNSIVEKVKTFIGHERRLNSIIASQGLFRFSEVFFEENPDAVNHIGEGTGNKIVSGVIEKLPAAFLESPQSGEEYVRILGRVAGQRSYRYILRKYLCETEQIDHYKLFIPEANCEGKYGEALTDPIIGYPKECSADTYLCGGSFDTEIEPINFEKYYKTKFFRALLGVKKTTHHSPPIVWGSIPLQNFKTDSDIDWTQSIADIDKQLYEKYHFSPDEISFIEENVTAMSDSTENSDK